MHFTQKRRKSQPYNQSFINNNDNINNDNDNDNDNDNNNNNSNNNNNDFVTVLSLGGSLPAISKYVSAFYFPLYHIFQFYIKIILTLLNVGAGSQPGRNFCFTQRIK